MTGKQQKSDGESGDAESSLKSKSSAHVFYFHYFPFIVVHPKVQLGKAPSTIMGY